MKKKKYTVLTTCPDYGSRNVGDKLIEQRTKELVEKERGCCEFLTQFREESLEEHLDEINQSSAILSCRLFRFETLLCILAHTDWSMIFQASTYR